MRWAWRWPRSCWRTSSIARATQSVDHRTYVFLGDGCLMEGISHEAARLAGAWKLNKLIAIYDDNGISIDGRVEPWFVDDSAKRFEAYGWNVIRDVDGHDVDAVDAAIAQGQARRRRADADRRQVPASASGSPNRAGTAKAHGEALGADEIKLTRGRARAGRHEPFVIPEAAYTAWDAKARGAEAEAAWAAKLGCLQGCVPRTGGRVHASHQGRSAQGLCPDGRRRDGGRARQGRDGGLAQGQPDRARGLHARAAGDARRLGRPDRLEPDQHRQRDGAALRCRRHTAMAAATSTTACASSAWPRS